VTDRPPPLLRYLLGLEGLALLRGWLRDGAGAGRRLEEIRTLLHEAEEPRPAPVELGVAQGYAEWAASYDAADNPLIAVEEPVVQAMLTQVSSGRALDAACGTGRWIVRLEALGHEVTGIDSSPEMLALARERSPATDLREGRLEALPFEADAFDLAVCALALTHLPELGPAIAELARVVSPGGRMVLTAMHPLLSALGGDALFSRSDGSPAFVREATHLHGAWLDAFAAAGMQVHACAEPAWRADTVAMIGKAARRIPEALEQALVGLPCVLVWELEAGPGVSPA